jgi:superfamily II DNA or RNA helicase
MNSAARAFRARYVLGLSATLDRPDNLTPLLHWTLGPKVFHATRDSEALRVTMAVFTGATREITRRDGQPLVAAMVTALAACRARNLYIAARVREFHAAGRVVLVLSDRIAQLKALHDLLLRHGVAEAAVGLFVGSTREADRPAQLARPVVLCSYGMASEGLDKREADTCVLATPKGRIEQCVGRIQRPCATKQSPLVLDVADRCSADDASSILVCLRWKRERFYRAQGYSVQQQTCDAT